MQEARPFSKREDPREREINDLISGYVDSLNAGEKVDPQQILRDHPSIGHQIVEGLQVFLDLGDDDLCEQVEESSPPLGTLGDYTLRRQIGRGGMGVVYDAWQNSMDRRVALKVLPAGIAADGKAYSRFMREAHAAGKLNHPNVVAVHASGQDEKTPYYAMEYIEGETLAQILRRLRAVEGNGDEKNTILQSVSQLLRKSACATGDTHVAAGRSITESATKAESTAKDTSLAYYYHLAHAFAGVADGLQHAHSRRIIHRDIKPSNLILDSEGRLRILDFGLARLEGQESLTASGDFVGTPLYMSPEQAQVRKIPIDHRTDIYSLGATMYEMLTWQPPFKGKDHQDTLSQIIERDPVDLRKVNPRIPRDLETIVLKCLRKGAGDRYGTAEALGQDLRRFVRGDPIEARPASKLERFHRAVWRRRRSLAVAVMAILLIVVAVLLFRNHRQSALADRQRKYEQTVLSAAGRLQIAKKKLEDLSDPVYFADSWNLTRIVLKELTRRGTERQIIAALDDLEKAAARSPDRPEAYYHRARGFCVLQQTEAALEMLKRALREDPDFIPAQVLHDELCAGGQATKQTPVVPEDGKTSSLTDLWRLAQHAGRSRNWREAARYYEVIATGEHPYLGLAVEAYLEAGLASLRAEELTAAVEYFTSARYLCPKAIEPSLLLARAHYLAGHPERAETILRDCYAASAASETAREIVTLYALLKDVDKALEWIAFIELRDPLFHMLKAALLVQTEKPEEAIKEVDEAIILSGNDYVAHLLRGTIHDRLSHREEATASYEIALRLNLTDKWVLRCYGAFLTKSRKYRKKGIGLLVQAKELYPEWPLIYQALGEAHYFHLQRYRQARYRQALEFYRAAIRLDPEYPAPYCGAGLCLGKLKRYEKAHESFDTAIGLDPYRRALVARVNKGYVLFLEGMEGKLEGRLEEARACFEEVVSMNTELEAHTRRYKGDAGLVYTLLHLGRKEEAIHALERARQALAGTVDREAELLTTVAEQGYFKMGDYAEAAGLCEEAYRLTGAARCVSRAGQYYAKLGHTGQAIEKYAKALAIDPGSKRTYMRLAGLLQNKTHSISGEAVDRILLSLDAAVRSCAFLRDIAGVLQSLTMIAEALEDSQRLEQIRDITARAIETTGGRDPDLLYLFAAIHANRSESREAVIALERALELPWAEETLSVAKTTGELQTALEEQRHVLNDNLPSYASIEARLSETTTHELILERFQAEATGEQVSGFTAYLTGRNLQLEGDVGHAVEHYKQVLSFDPESPEPALRLAECYQVLENSRGAKDVLRRQLAKTPPVRARRLWDAWLGVCFGELSRPPEDLVADFPAVPTEPDEMVGEDLPSAHFYADSVRWLLERLIAGDPVRINTGGEDYRSPTGVRWSCDRFFVGGRRASPLGPQPLTDPWPNTIDDTDDDPLYQTQRWFPRNATRHGGYRIPLPSGNYRVILHFSECMSKIKDRSFDVLVEKRPVLTHYMPIKAGYTKPASEAIHDTIQIHDGFLDIEFRHQTRNPIISAIEIHRVD